jgi:D-arabinose 1-dehydrogenase-like Zn-dependent alcohol dehydrogenase
LRYFCSPQRTDSALYPIISQLDRAAGFTHEDDLLSGGRKIEGALTGTPATGDATLKFSVLSGVSPMIETMPLPQSSGSALAARSHSP